MKHSHFFVPVFAFLALVSYGFSEISLGEAELLNRSWEFTLDQQEVVSVKQLNPNPETWEHLDLPHDWSVRGQLSPEHSSCTGYLPGGIGWYKKTLEIPSSQELGNRVYLYFEGVYNRSEVYLNGNLLGKRPNGYVSFFYDATPYVNFNATNTIAVRVDHSREADSRWYTGSGIYRNVWLVRAHDQHLAPWGIFAHPKVLSTDRALLHIEAEIVNEAAKAEDYEVIVELYSKFDKPVARKTLRGALKGKSKEVLLTELEVENPELWSVDSPTLYTLKTTFVSSGTIVDESTIKTGFRTFNFDPDKGFSLNGKNMKMKGICLHHDAGVLGAAVPRIVWEERLKQLKRIGCNAIRTSHNPQATDLYELCDELGFLVMNEAFDEWEFPKRKWLEGWNVGEPGFEGSYDFFKEWGERDLADMVRRDRNHISIFAWSIGNEVDYPNDPYSHPVLDGSSITQPMYGGYKPEQPDANRLGDIAERLVAVVKQHDTSRPVTAALAGVVMSNETGYPFALDIAGYNYSESRYKEDHATYPDRVIYGSENRHDYEAWKAVLDHEFVFGQFLWTGIDYLGESGRWPSRGFYSGLIDFGGNIKPRGRFREALWSENPVIYIGTSGVPSRDYQSMDSWPVWNYSAGEQVRVVCYTNAVKAGLIINGNVAGEVKSANPKSGIISWDVPFEAGVLEVVGYDDKGKVSCTDKIRTHGAPVKMVVRSNSQVIEVEEGVAIVELKVIDAKGNRVMDYEGEVTCTVDGNARLLGLEASNNRDMSDYSDNVHNLFHGRILAYLKSTGEPGQVVVNFTSSELPGISLHLEVK